ncbi:MAG: tyrosine-type recombinase/integrase [Verrucomicrobiia bacterium]
MSENLNENNGGATTPEHLKFRAVRDSRKRKIPGLWCRGKKGSERYYARLSVIDKSTGLRSARRIPLPTAHTVDEAKAQIKKMQVDRDEGTLDVASKQTRLGVVIDAFEGFYGEDSSTYSPRTLASYKMCFKHLREYFGGTAIQSLSTRLWDEYVATEKKAGRPASVIKQCRTALLSLFKFAERRELVRRRPDMVMAVECPPPAPKPLLSLETIRYIVAQGDGAENDHMRDFFLLMAFSGLRSQEASRATWSMVDLDRKVINLAATVFNPAKGVVERVTKNGKPRAIHMNGDLFTLLTDMRTRKWLDSDWLFPSRMNTKRRDHVVGLHRVWWTWVKRAKDKIAKDGPVPGVDLAVIQKGHANHLLRHFFISQCVMAGFSFKQIASWVGHSKTDLIDTVYGHLSNEYAEQCAANLKFSR